MEGLLLLLVPIGIVIVLVVAALMLADVALFGGAARVEDRERTRRRWQPPYVRGQELVAWARKVAAEVVRTTSGSAPSERAGSVEVSEALQAGATLAMLSDLPRRELQRVLPCPSGGQGLIGVTADEALTLAEHVRWDLPKRDGERIRARARELADEPTTEPKEGGGVPRGCALQGADGICTVFASRPVQCRALHAGMLLRRWAPSPVDAGTDLADARSVCEGIQDGWVTALAEAGLDPNVYELNSALAAALGSDDAYLRWLEGEPLFAGCRPARASA